MATPFSTARMDNAAGVATVLDTAATVRETKPKVKRSILFLIVTGERKAVGSKYFAGNPTSRLRPSSPTSTPTCFCPCIRLKRLTVYGLDESTLGDDVRAVRRTWHRGATRSEPERNSFIRSDQLQLHPAWHSRARHERRLCEGESRGNRFQSWLTDRYHAVTDDLQQPVDKTAAATFDLLAAGCSSASRTKARGPPGNPTLSFAATRRLSEERE